MVAAAALPVVIMVVMLVVMVAAAALPVVIMVVMLVVVMAAAAFPVVIMVVMLVVMVAAAAFLIIMVVVVMVMVLMLLLQLCQLLGQGRLALQSVKDLLTGELAPGGGDDGGSGIVLSQHGHGGVQLCLGNGIGPGQDDGGSGFDLVVVELAEVLHVDLHLTGVHHCHGIAQGHGFAGDLVHGTDHIGQLAHAGGLNDDPVGIILLDHLGQGLAKVAHQGAADTAGVHLGDVNARILEEAAVNTDLAELVLNEHQFLTLVGLLDHLLDQSGFTGSEETGININFCHKKHLL